MKIYKITTILSIALFSLTNINANNCPNGGLENGDFSNWKFYEAQILSPILGFADLSLFNSISNPNIPNNPPNVFLESTGNDPVITNTTIPKTIDGNYSLRLNENAGQGHGTIASYTVQVDANMKISFSYALIMQDPDHYYTQQPFFAYWISKTDNLQNSLSPSNEVLKKKWLSNDSWFQTQTNTGNQVPYKYKEWQQECYDLSIFNQANEECEINVGDYVTIYFYTQDCTEGGHFSYAYIDGLCQDIVKPFFTLNYADICKWDGLVADGSLTQNEEFYYWTIENLGVPNSGISMSELQNNNVTTFDIGDWINNLSSSDYGLYNQSETYRICLYVKACSDGWTKYCQDVNVDLPNLTAENVHECCESGDPNVNLYANVIFDPGDAINGNFEWFDENNQSLGKGNVTTLFNGGQPIGISTELPVNTNFQSGVFRVEYTDDNGCFNKKWVYILYLGYPDVTLKRQECWPEWDDDILKPCGVRKIKAYLGFTPCEGDDWAISNWSDWKYYTDKYINTTGVGNATYSWNTGETTQEITMQEDITQYTCRVTFLDWPCPINGSNSITKTIDADVSWFTGALPTGPSTPQNANPGDLWYTSGCGAVLNPTYTLSPFMVARLGSQYANFAPRAYNAYSYCLVVYNRWGQVVHRTSGNRPSDFGPYGYYDTCEGLYNTQIKWQPKIYGPTHTSTTSPDSKLLNNSTYWFILWLENCDNNGANAKDVLRGDFILTY